jgi:hypothetical protein
LIWESDAEKVETSPTLRESGARMPKILCALAWIVLAASLVILPGCATTDADLDYTREKPADNSADHSYHGWNNANY